MVYDFHTHTFLSDGVLSPMELIRRAVVNGYKAIAITDHCGLEDQERIVPTLVRECAAAAAHWDIVAIPGVELTHLPPELIDKAARKARELGAQLIIVHGETVVEPVAPGTNRAAVSTPAVDVLAHPGLLTEEDARAAVQAGISLEISSRRGHSLSNGLVVQLGLRYGAQLIVNSDAHAPEDLLTQSQAQAVATGAGLDPQDLSRILEDNPKRLLQRLSGYPRG